MRGLLVLLLLLVGLAVVADRVAVGYAQDEVAAQLAAKGGLKGTPTVEITGFPFLTQAIAGRYDDVRISLTAAELGQPAGTAAAIDLRGVRVPLRAVLSGSVTRIPVDTVEGTATLSYALLSAKLGPSTRLTREGSGLRITRTVDLMGQQIPLTATGKLALEGDDIVVHVSRASGAGVSVPSFVLDRAVGLLDLRYTVPPLPFGLKLTGVTPAATGVTVNVAATNAVLGTG